MELIQHILGAAQKAGIDLTKNRFILACSGGVDSMVLVYLFKMLNVDCVIAHVNYGLRGVDADNAEKLVEKTAIFFNWKFEVLHAQKEMQQHKGESTQMAARRIRYDWFETLKLKHNANYLVLGHQIEDQVETFFIQLLRSSASEGLSGMRVLQNDNFRPLLGLSKLELIAFAHQNNVLWEEDGSNMGDEYLRNKIRHHILPAFNKIYSNSTEAIVNTIHHLQSEKSLLKSFVTDFQQQNFFPFENGWKIEKSGLTRNTDAAQLLFELLQSFGFNYQQCEQIATSLHGKHGASFYTSTWSIYVDRTLLILLPKKNNPSEYNISQLDLLSFEIVEKLPYTFEKEVAYIDGDKLSKNLVLRTWNVGDYFYPTGMNGRKKLSDYYTDLKLSKEEKGKQLLLLSDNEVVWVLNKRLDERFAAQKETKNIVRIYLNQ